MCDLVPERASPRKVSSELLLPYLVILYLIIWNHELFSDFLMSVTCVSPTISPILRFSFFFQLMCHQIVPLVW